MDVKRMKGLIRKEWILLRWGILVLFSLNIFLVLVVPPLLNRSFDLPLNAFENTLVITGTWFVFMMVVSLGILYTSLEKEIKQPDIWLHSPAPMWELVGVKAMVAAVVTFLLLVLNGLLVAGTFFVSDAYGSIPRFSGAMSLLSVMISIYLKSIYIMAFGYLFWSCYQVGRPRFSGLSVIFTTLLFFAGIFTGMVLLEWIRSSKILTAIKTFGPVRLTSVPFYDGHNNYFFTGIVPDGVAFTVGGLVLYGALTIIFFAVGSKLFETKVRL